MKKKKKYLLVCGMLAILIFGVTQAYFQKSVSVDNKFQSSEAKVYLNEKFAPNDKWVPGEEKQKEVRFGNEGEVDAILRVKFTASLTLADGTEDSEVSKKVQLNFTEDFLQNWIEKDGWYYYNKVLASDDLTDITLKSVTISDQLGNDEHGIQMDYSGASCDVKIEGELLQASLAAEAANYMNWGLIPTVSGDTVTWN